jgi:hypothetical protein
MRCGRPFVPLLACLALTGASCLHSVAALIGDGGPDAGPGSRGGPGGPPCTDDSQCVTGSYCDFTATPCPNDEFIWTASTGTCQRDCGDACPTDCQVDEDCSPTQACVATTGVDGVYCTWMQPCSSGAKCIPSPCGDAPFSCGIPCSVLAQPHRCDPICVCPGNACTLDGGGGTAPDAGPVCVGGVVSDLSAATVYTQNAYYNVTSADLNGDGLLDVVATFERIDVFFGLADGGLSSPTVYPFVTTNRVAIGDLDGDGLPDVLSPTGPTIDILSNDVRGTLRLKTSYTPRFGWAVSAAIGDVNGDGWPDFVVGESQGAELFLGSYDGSFHATDLLPLPDTYATWGAFGGLVLADLDGDGSLDVAVRARQGPLEVLLQTAAGTFEESTYFISTALGGLLALPSTHGTPDLALSLESTGVQILHNGGDGTFSDGGYFPSPAQVDVGVWMALGDFNGDCISDLVVSGPDVVVLYGDGDGGYHQPTVVLNGNGDGLAGVAALGPTESPRAIAIADFNDGGLTVLGDASKHQEP